MLLGLSTDAWQIVTAISTVSIATFGLALAVYEGRQTRLHNKKSVRPNLTIHTFIGESRDHTPGIYLMNSGLGPAKILSAEYTISNWNERWALPTNPFIFMQHLTKALDLKDDDAGYHALFDGDVLMAGQEIPLFQSAKNWRDPKCRKSILNIIEHTRIRI